ncbi:MAG: sodium-dependent transporter [Planctomycetota bacterium]
MTDKEQWGTRVGLVLAMAGNAVGLGNFLRFPAQAAQNGGGAFIIPYLVSFLLMGIPLLWVEWAMGRHGGQHGHHSAPGMLDVLGRGKFWKYLGVFGLFTNLAVAAYYCYIESWTLGYVWYSVSQTFSGMAPGEVAQHFTNYIDGAPIGLANWPSVALGFFAVTLALNVYILSRGLAKGIELVAKIGMPLLLAFGAFLAIRALTLGPGVAGATHSAMEGVNFLWQPQYHELGNPKVWVAAAGQIFFTLSVGMGTIHCYASYVGKDQDVALNGASAGWMNEFVEVILGASVVVPLATAYLGLDWVKDNAGLTMAFRTMPTLFENWGPTLAMLAGTMWFGLLFFAGITSSLAMGQPVMAFLQDEFGHSRRKAAVLFGLATLLLAIPCIFFFSAGAFDEFDWWAGSVALVIFALAEAILFGWVFGIDKGWAEITRGADIRVPTIFKFVIKYVTPLFLFVVFAAYLVKPMGNDFAGAFSSLTSGTGWPLAPDGILGQIFRVGVTDYTWFDAAGEPTRYMVQDLTRLLLMLTFLGLCLMVKVAWKRRAARGRPS